MSSFTHDTDDFTESDLLEDMDDFDSFYFDVEEIYADVYDFPELLIPLEEYQGEL